LEEAWDLSSVRILNEWSSSNSTPENYRAVKALHIKYGSVTLWLIIRLESGVALKSDENFISKTALCNGTTE